MSLDRETPPPRRSGYGAIVDKARGLPLRLDPNAESAHAEEPAFIARPAGAPVYHGFPILEDVEVDGFKLGVITDWEAGPSDYGDAFIVAPDNSRCGLIWELDEEAYVESSAGFTEARWGVWNVGFPHQMDSRTNARRNLAHVIA